MSFHDVKFPDDIGYGSQGGPGFKTDIITSDSGKEQRVVRWSQVRHKYNVAYGIRNYTDLADVKDFYMGRMGAAYTFRFKDWADCNSTGSGSDVSLTGESIDDEDQLIDTGDGVETTYQLVKRYTSGSVTRVRNITKPVAGTVRIGVNAVEQMSGWSINTSTGVITFDAAPTDGHDITWGGEFDTHCRFDESVDDVLNMTMDSFGGGSFPSIEIIEVIDEDELSDEFYFGGAAYMTLTGDLSITESLGRVLSIDPGGSHRNLSLPDVTTESHPGGGPYWYIFNKADAAENLVVKSGGTTVTTIAQDGSSTIVLGLDSSDDYTWLAI